MREARTDRRSTRTRDALTRALMDLLLRERYSAITVQDLVDTANVGRSTFYAHFTDKDDLLADGVRRLLASFDDTEIPPGTACPYPTLALLHHIAAQPDRYRTLAKDRGLPLFLTTMQDTLTATLADRLADRLGPADTPAIPPRLLAAMVTSMLVVTIRTWMENGLSAPADQVDRMFHTAATATITAGLRP